MIELSIIIVKYRAKSQLDRCLASIPHHQSWKVIVVDNNQANRGFARGCNQGVKQAQGKYILFLNPDSIVPPGTIEKLLEKLKASKNIGIIGPQLLDQRGEAYLSTTCQPAPLSALVVYSFLNTLIPHNRWSRIYWYQDFDLNSERVVESISGAAMMMSQADFNKVGGFDENFFMYWEDYDLCRRLLKTGKEIRFYPAAKVTHLRGKSTNKDSYEIKKWFRESRFRFFRKHFGWVRAAVMETLLVAQEEWRLVAILMWAGALRFSRLPALTPLFGDQARDYLAALEILKTGHLPLLGIPSSVPRFKQGPLFIWFLALAFSLLGISAASAGLMAGVFGLLAVAGTYLLADRWRGRRAGVIAALVMATSPLAVAQSRMAYHINPIPLFSVIYLAALLKPFKRNRDGFWVTLAFSLLFQFELAVTPLILLVGIYYLRYRKQISSQRAFFGWGAVGLIIGLLPQVIFDLTHRFQQLGTFAVWVVFRLAAFSGLVPGRANGVAHISDVGGWFYLYGSRFVSWDRPGIFWIGLIMVLFGIYLAITKYRQSFTLRLISFWLGLITIGYAVHGGPSEAYFPVLFVPTALMIGFVGSTFKSRMVKSFILLTLLLGVYNSRYIVSHDYLLSTPKSVGVNSPYGAPYWVYEEIARYLIQQAGGKPLHLMAIGPGTEFSSYLDNLRFVLSLHGYPLDDLNGYPVWVISGKGDALPTIPNTKQVSFEGVIINVPL